MKSFGELLIFLFVCTLINAAPTLDSVKILSYENKVTDDGSYEFSYELSDGQSRHEKGVLTKVDEAEVYEVTGSYSFKGTDGKHYLVEYTAGVNGYNATIKEKQSQHAVVSFLDPTVIKTLVG